MTSMQPSPYKTTSISDVQASGLTGGPFLTTTGTLGSCLALPALPSDPEHSPPPSRRSIPLSATTLLSSGHTLSGRPFPHTTGTLDSRLAFLASPSDTLSIHHHCNTSALPLPATILPSLATQATTTPALPPTSNQTSNHQARASTAISATCSLHLHRTRALTTWKTSAAS